MCLGERTQCEVNQAGEAVSQEACKAGLKLDVYPGNRAKCKVHQVGEAVS